MCIKEKFMIIDKSNLIKKALENHPAVYIEGAAACGKTTAVNIFLEAHRDLDVEVIDLNQGADLSYLEGIMVALSEKGVSAEKKYIFVCRDKMPKEMVKLLWAGQLSIVPAGALMLSVDEVGHLVSQAGFGLPEEELHQSADELYRLTGGWPGCVSVLINLAKAHAVNNSEIHESSEILENTDAGKVDWKKYLDSFEVQSYIKSEIVGKLSDKEQEMLDIAKALPFISGKRPFPVVENCESEEVLKDLQRKGILVLNERKDCWNVEPLFSGKPDKFDRKAYRDYLKNHFLKLSLKTISNIDFDIWTSEEELESPQLCWLRAVKGYLNQDFSVIEREMSRVKSTVSSSAENSLATEIYLNIAFINSSVDMDQWLKLLEEYGPSCSPVRIYWLENYGINMLTGARELSPLFINTAREEKRRKGLLGALLSHKSYVAVQLAKLEFDYETLTKYILGSEQWQTMREIAGDDKDHYPWRFKAMCLEMLTKMQPAYSGQEAEEIKEMIDRILGNLKWDQGQAMKWLKDFRPDFTLKVSEYNYYQLFIQVREYLQLGQYDKAGRILTQLVPYVKQYQRNRILAEVMFQQAIVDWHRGSQGNALKNTIESFIYTGKWHFVSFYISYGQVGRDVMEAYIKWLQTNEPKKWQRKKRYNYGHVLKMPQEDYLETVLRLAKRSAKRDLMTPVVENLTMTEILVLQNINKGLTNAEICQAMNLKLPTVKTHIYNIYKKMGVGSRTQAINKAKERGLLK